MSAATLKDNEIHQFLALVGDGAADPMIGEDVEFGRGVVSVPLRIGEGPASLQIYHSGFVLLHGSGSIRAAYSNIVGVKPALLRDLQRLQKAPRSQRYARLGVDRENDESVSLELLPDAYSVLLGLFARLSRRASE